jgi:hypothetical protein
LWELVGQRDAQLVGLLARDRGDVRLLPGAPLQLRLGIAVAVGLHDPRDVDAELTPDALEHRRAPAVLDGVVEQRADRLVLGAPHRDHE